MIYKNYVDVFHKDMAENLTVHCPIPRTINMEAGINLLDGLIFNLLEVELKTLQAYSATTSAKCKSVRKPQTNLQDTPVDLTGAPKSFQMLPGHPGAKQSALRLCKSILRWS